MSKKEPAKTYTFPLDYIDQIIEESETQISLAKDLLTDLLEEADFSESHVAFVLVEVLWSNMSIRRLIEKELQNKVVIESETTGEKEMIVLSDTVVALQSLMLSRFYANLDLNMSSYSLSLN
tara:strand:- start:1208 stop:1573 length:366 start_codon:yes stop_codon:yes gene_type:complete